MVAKTRSIYYRFGSERGIWRELKLDGIDGVLVSDLKILIAQESSLTREFARKTNLTISLYDGDTNTKPEPLDDNVIVHVGTRVIVNRVAWTPAQPIYHEAKSKIDVEIVEEKKKLPKFPTSLLCHLCGIPLEEPMLLNCSSNCGSSGCYKCVTNAFKNFVIKSEPGTESASFSLSQRRKCPFCKKGLVSGFVMNRRIKSLLSSLDYKNFEIPEIQIVEDKKDADDKPLAWDYYSDIPKHFLMCIEYSLVDTMTKNMMIPVYVDSQINARLSCYQYALSKDSTVSPAMGEVFVLVLSFVGGGCSISPMGLVQLGEEVTHNMEFIRLTRAHKAYNFQWVHKSDIPIMLPSRRQPLYSYLGGKQCQQVALNQKDDVMWRYRNELMIEVGLKREPFEALFKSIFGVKSTFLQRGGYIQSRNWLDAAYKGGPTPIYITQKCEVKTQNKKCAEDVVDTGNPYLGYVAILPFLSESQFLKIRATQRRMKEKFLQQLTRKVTKHIPRRKGEPVLERAYGNVWKRHIEYQLPSAEMTPAEKKD